MKFGKKSGSVVIPATGPVTALSPGLVGSSAVGINQIDNSSHSAYIFFPSFPEEITRVDLYKNTPDGVQSLNGRASLSRGYRIADPNQMESRLFYSNGSTPFVLATRISSSSPLSSSPEGLLIKIIPIVGSDLYAAGTINLTLNNKFYRIDWPEGINELLVDYDSSSPVEIQQTQAVYVNGNNQDQGFRPASITVNNFPSCGVITTDDRSTFTANPSSNSAEIRGLALGQGSLEIVTQDGQSARLEYNLLSASGNTLDASSKFTNVIVRDVPAGGIVSWGRPITFNQNCAEGSNGSTRKFGIKNGTYVFTMMKDGVQSEGLLKTLTGRPIEILADEFVFPVNLTTVDRIPGSTGNNSRTVGNNSNTNVGGGSGTGGTGTGGSVTGGTGRNTVVGGRRRSGGTVTLPEGKTLPFPGSGPVRQPPRELPENSDPNSEPSGSNIPRNNTPVERFGRLTIIGAPQGSQLIMRLPSDQRKKNNQP